MKWIDCNHFREKMRARSELLETLRNNKAAIRGDSSRMWRWSFVVPLQERYQNWPFKKIFGDLVKIRGACIFYIISRVVFKVLSEV